jgi:peptidoglycan/LPS O-acetylase OafA/YrhL
VGAASPERERLRGLDALKGLAIVGVVAIHAQPTDSPSYHAHVVNGVARLAVPLFLMVTGFLIGAGGTTRAKLALYFRKFLRLHLLYGAFYFAVRPIRGAPFFPITAGSVLAAFYAYSYPGQFYLLALTQIYFVLAYVVPERWHRSTVLLLASLALAAVTVELAERSFDAPEIPPALSSYWEASPFLWLFPCCLGMWMGARFAGSPAVGAVQSAALALAAAGVAALDLPATGREGHENNFGYARWSIVLATGLLGLGLPWAARSLRLPGVEALGRESFGIFVLNPLILDVLEIPFGAPADVSVSLLFVAVALAIAVPASRALRRWAPFAFP